MAKSSKASRASNTKPRRAPAPARPRARRAARPAKAAARSAPKVKPAVARPAKGAPSARKAKPVAARKSAGAAARQPARATARKPAVATSKPSAARTTALTASASSPALRSLSADEQRAVTRALAGKATLLTRAPRARDAALFVAAASAARKPVVVASPLASELFEQATQLAQVDVVAFGSFAAPARQRASTQRLLRGGRLLVVLEPASLSDAVLARQLGKVELALLGLAAAHAGSEHAHELSPAYLGLREVVRSFAAPVLATCTATSARVVDQVSEAIGAGASGVITRAEPELLRSAQVARAAERKSLLLATIAGQGAPGIALVATAQEADAVFAELSAQKVACVRAHSGMSVPERAAALARFVDPREQLVLVTQSPHACPSGLASSSELVPGLNSAPPRSDLRFVVHYQAPLSPEQQFEDSAWLPAGGASLVLADSSDAALVQALLAQQRIKPAAVEALAQALAQAADGQALGSDTLALRGGTSRRSAERVLSAFAERGLITRKDTKVTRRAPAEQLLAAGRLLAARFAALRAGDAARAELVARYVTRLHDTAPSLAKPLALPVQRQGGAKPHR